MPATAARAAAVEPRRHERGGSQSSKRGAGRHRALTTAPRPRRVSGPARTGPPVRRRSQAEAGVVLGSIAALERLSRSRLGNLRWVDRLIRGRIWIALVAFALIGIVTLQLVLLRLNASIGRALEHESLLQRENAALSIENSEAMASQTVEARAAGMGMELVPLGALRFLDAHPGVEEARAAAGVLSAAVGASTTASSGAPLGSSGTGAQSSALSATAEPSTSASRTSPAAASPGTATGESDGAAGEAATGSAAEGPRTSAESTTASESPMASEHAPSANQPQSAFAPAGSSSPEATPAGGTQAGPPG
jgi:hypothetical protein